MATFQEFHGISLAANSWIENLFVEQLSSDPVPVGPGRVWYNTTDKVFKQSTLDATGGVIVRVFATAEDLAAEVATLAGDISGLTADLAAEVTARAAADATLTADLAAEVTARIAADAALGNRIDALGNAFNYVGALVGGADAGTATDLSALPAGEKDSGDYYKVTTAGYFKVGTAQAAFYANVGDGLVFNITGTVDKIDNTDSTVDGTTDEIVVTGSADTGFIVGIDPVFNARVTAAEGGIAAEASARVAADTALQAALDAEVTARQATDANLASEISRATAVEGALVDLTTSAKSSLVAAINEQVTNLAAEASVRAAADVAEASARTAADATLTANLAAEVTARTAADATEASARAAADAALTTAVSDEASARAAADAALTANLAAETTARAAADTVLTDNLAAEVSARTAADATLTANLAAEVTARTAADATLTADLAAEVTARAAADVAEASARTAAIAAEASARAAADGDLSTLQTSDQSSLVAAINEVKVLAGDGVDAFRTQVNNARYVDQSVAAATSHTFVHNLGSFYVDVSVWIDRGDGVWRNDMAGVSILSADSIKVDLTAARNVMVTVENMSQFISGNPAP